MRRVLVLLLVLELALMGRTVAGRLGFGMDYAGAAGSFALTSAPDGGWPGQTGAVYDEQLNRTFYGYVDNAGNVEARSKDHTTGADAEGTLHAALQIDHHNSPGILVRASDSRILAAYSRHDGAELYLRISTDPGDVTAWGAEVDLDSQLGGSNYTYPNLFQTSDGTIWLFYRTEPINGTSKLAYSTSTDGGATWAAQTIVYTVSGKDTYWRIDLNADRFDFVVSDGTLDADNASAYHFYLEGGSYYETDGTLIAGGLPFDQTDLTLIYDGSGGNGVRLPFGLAGNGGMPVAVLSTQPGGALDYWYVAWDGAAWQANLIVNAGGAAPFVEGGLGLDLVNPQVVYLSRFTAGQWEMFRYLTADLGASFSSDQLTDASASAQFYPVCVRNRHPGLRVIWLDGSFTDFDTFSLGVSGSAR